MAVWKFKPAEPRPVARFDYEVPAGQQLSDPGGNLAVSPDGRLFVYSTTKGIYLRSVDALDAKLIAGTEGPAVDPFFSPDGKWVGYHSITDKKLKKIAVGGGAPVILCDQKGYSGSSWGADDTIVALRARSQGWPLAANLLCTIGVFKIPLESIHSGLE